MEFAFNHAKSEVSVERDRPIVGCKVCAMMPDLPAGEIATNHGLVERDTHPSVELVRLHVIPVLASCSEQQGPWINDGNSSVCQRFRVASHLPVILLGKVVEIPILRAQDSSD